MSKQYHCCKIMHHFTTPLSKIVGFQHIFRFVFFLYRSSDFRKPLETKKLWIFAQKIYFFLFFGTVIAPLVSQKRHNADKKYNN